MAKATGTGGRSVQWLYMEEAGVTLNYHLKVVRQTDILLIGPVACVSIRSTFNRFF